MSATAASVAHLVRVMIAEVLTLMAGRITRVSMDVLSIAKKEDTGRNGISFQLKWPKPLQAEQVKRRLSRT